VPRPKEREFTITHCFSMEKWLKDQLELEANENGISMSKLVEKILLEYFERKTRKQEKNDGAADPPDDPPPVAKEKIEGIDPLVELELEELTNWIRGFESGLADYQELKKNPPKRTKGMLQWEFEHAMQNYKADLRIKKNDLYSDWQIMRKKFEKIRRKIPKAKEQEISKKLADLKRKLINS